MTVGKHEGRGQIRAGFLGLTLRHRWFAILVAMPIMLAALYYCAIASDEFVSQSRFVVKSSEGRGPQVSTLANLIQTSGISRGQEETSAVLDYLRSRNALQALLGSVDVRAAYARPGTDRLSRFPRPFEDPLSFENLYEFYSDKVEAYADPESGLAVLRVRAFDPAQAEAMNRHLLALGERLVNALNERAHGQAVREARRRVAEAEARAAAARRNLMSYRNRQQLMDPERQAGGVFTVMTALTSERAALQARLDQMRGATPGNPAIPGLRGRIAALGTEIDALTQRITGADGAIASKLPPYETLLAEQEFATQSLAAAQAALEQARNSAARQQYYLERVVEPNRPDKAAYPRRLKSTLTIAAGILCLWFIGWMFVVGILEHAPED